MNQDQGQVGTEADRVVVRSVVSLTGAAAAVIIATNHARLVPYTTGSGPVVLAGHRITCRRHTRRQPLRAGRGVGSFTDPHQPRRGRLLRVARLPPARSAELKKEAKIMLILDETRRGGEFHV